MAVSTKKRTLSDAVKGSDAFIGLSVENILTPKMLKSMKKNPLVFAMANPNPEINPELAHKTRSDVIMATGRSDYPNQANNVLGFPGVFRGALDVQATCINEEMKMAAAKALAKLARDDVPESVSQAYDDKQFQFGSHYILPKPFDPRVVQKVASAVAKAAIKTKVAKKPIKDFKAYDEKLESLEGIKKSFVTKIINRVLLESKKKNKKPQIVFPEGDSRQILKAVNQALFENMIDPLLIGDKQMIENQIKDLGFKKQFKRNYFMNVNYYHCMWACPTPLNRNMLNYPYFIYVHQPGHLTYIGHLYHVKY